METIILLHGALGYSKDLEPLAISLQQKGLKAQLFNFSGHGDKPFSADFNASAFVNELREFILTQKDNRVHLFGYSMGGYIALLYAGSFPFEGTIVALGTRLSWTPEFAAAEMLKLDPDKMEQKIPAFAGKLSQSHGEKWKDLVRNTATLLRDLGDNNYLNNTLLSGIRSKVVLSIGDGDNMADAADTLRVSKTIKNGELCVLPSTRHQIESVNTAALTDIIYKAIKN